MSLFLQLCVPFLLINSDMFEQICGISTVAY